MVCITLGADLHHFLPFFAVDVQCEGSITQATLFGKRVGIEKTFADPYLDE